MKTKEEARKIFKKRLTIGGAVGRFIKAASFDSALYIGASARLKRPGVRLFKTKYANQLVKHCDYIDLLEIWPENIKGLKEKSNLPFRNLILGDARTIDEHVDQKYDLIFWWHGPEHIYEDEISPTVEKMKKVCNKHIVFGCPWGVYEQGTVYGNPYEEHKSHLQPEFYEDLGFLTSTAGQPNQKNGNIIAWTDIRWESENTGNITGNRE